MEANTNAASHDEPVITTNLPAQGLSEKLAINHQKTSVVQAKVVDRAASPRPSLSLSSSHLPVTVFTDPNDAAIESIAAVNAAAGLTDRFSIMLSHEKWSTSTLTYEMSFANNYERIYKKLCDGAFMVESCNFAAVACWAPPSSTARMEADDGDLSFPAFSSRPIMQRCMREWATVRRAVLGEREYWYVTLMARDPNKRAVKGAVRAVLEIGIRWADEDEKPIWLEAGNPRARDIYAAFGFEERGVTWHGGGPDTGVPIWSMIREPRLDHMRN